jgi:hypothetical protein
VPTRPLEEVQQHAREKVSEFERRNLEQESLRRDREGTRHLEARLGVYEFLIIGDPFGQHTLPAYLRYDVTGSNIVSWNNFFKEPDNILRINPVRCGVLKYGVHLILHRYAVGFEMKSHVITSMIHLYAACRFAYPEDPVWPDMEYFLHHQDVDNLFFGGLPTSMEEALKKYLLAQGISATNYARNRRSDRLKTDQGRCPSNPCLLEGILADLMSGGEAMKDLMVLDLIRAVTDLKSL